MKNYYNFIKEGLYINSDFNEKTFYTNSHLDDLYVMFDFIPNKDEDTFPGTLYYFYKKTLIFTLYGDLGFSVLHINDDILYKFRKYYCVENSDIINMIKPQLIKYFNLVDTKYIATDLSERQHKITYRHFNI